MSENKTIAVKPEEPVPVAKKEKPAKPIKVTKPVKRVNKAVPLELEDRLIEPTGTVVIVQQSKIVDKEGKTASGLFLPKEVVQGGSAELFEGTIVAIGESVRRFKVGDVVEFGHTTFATKTQSNGDEFLYIYENQIPSKIIKK